MARPRPRPPLLGAQVSAELVAASVGARTFARWRAQGLRRSDDHEWDLRRVQLGDGDLVDHFTKIAYEVTGSHRKEGRRAGGCTPMQLLADAVDRYERQPWRGGGS